MQMGQTTSFANENNGLSQQLPNTLPQIFINQNNPPSFSQQTPEPTAQTNVGSEDDSGMSIPASQVFGVGLTSNINISIRFSLYAGIEHRTT
jgi:hypothetical protein